MESNSFLCTFFCHYTFLLFTSFTHKWSLRFSSIISCGLIWWEVRVNAIHTRSRISFSITNIRSYWITKWFTQTWFILRYKIRSFIIQWNAFTRINSWSRNSFSTYFKSIYFRRRNFSASRTFVFRPILSSIFINCFYSFILSRSRYDFCTCIRILKIQK